MTICKASSFVVIVHLMLGGVASAGQGTLWRPLKASHSRLLSGSRQSGSHDLTMTSSTLSRYFTCSLSCHQAEWCNVWCPDPSSTTSCLFFDMFVVPGYQETNMADALDCYTRSLKDYAVGATIEGAIAALPLRVKENLIDGIYDFEEKDKCYYSSDTSDAWFRLDLGSEKPIRRIKMVLHPSTTSAPKYYDIEVRVGSLDVTGDFSTYTQFGYFPGPTSPSQEVVFQYEDPIMARYVSVQRWSQPDCSGDQCRLMVCHIEIN